MAPSYEAFAIRPDLPLPTLEGQSSATPRERALAGMADADGTVLPFIDNEMIVQDVDATELARLIQRYDATVMHDGVLPISPLADPERVRPELANSGMVMLRVNLETADLDAAEKRLLESGLDPETSFSSERSYRLAAIIAEERLDHGTEATLNSLVQNDLSAELLTSTAELADNNGDFMDGFLFPFTQDTGFNISRGWQYFGLLKSQIPYLAIVDRNFGYHSDFGPEDQIIQWDAAGTAFQSVMQTSSTSKQWHGLLVASRAAARLSNNAGAVGTSAGPTQLMFMNRSTVDHGTVITDMYSVALCIYAAGLSGADVMVFSFAAKCNKACRDWGFFTGFSPLAGAVRAAHQAGIVMVAGAGNRGNSAPGGIGRNLDTFALYPARFPQVLTVGGLDFKTKARHPESNYGEAVDIWAPYSFLPTSPVPSNPGALSAFAGTSSAAPFVAGIVAMMRAIDPTLELADVRDILQATAGSSSDPDVAVGYVRSLQALVETAKRAGVSPRGDAHEPNNYLAQATNASTTTQAQTWDGFIALEDRDLFALSYDDYTAGPTLTMSYESAGLINPLKLTVNAVDNAPLSGNTTTDLAKRTESFTLGTLSPGAQYFAVVEGATAEELNAYTLSATAAVPAALPPDDYDSVSSNDDPATASKIVLQPETFIKTVHPLSKQIGNKGAFALTDTLSFHSATDRDFYRVSIDPSYQHSPEMGDCPTVTPAPPAGFELIQSSLQGVLHIRRWSAQLKIQGSALLPQHVPIKWVIETPLGTNISNESWVTWDADNVWIKCPRTNLPNGEVVVGLDPQGSRDLYGLTFTYREAWQLYHDTSTAQHWYDQTRSIKEIEFPETLWLDPADPTTLRFAATGRPGALPDELLPDYVVVNWPESSRFGIELTTEGRSRPAKVELLDWKGELVAQSAGLPGDRPPASLSLTHAGLPAGTYFLRVEGAPEGVQYSVAWSGESDP